MSYPYPQRTAQARYVMAFLVFTFSTMLAVLTIIGMIQRAKAQAKSMTNKETTEVLSPLIPIRSSNTLFVEFVDNRPHDCSQCDRYYVQLPGRDGPTVFLTHLSKAKMATNILPRIWAITSLGTTVWTEEEWTNSPYLSSLTNVVDRR